MAVQVPATFMGSSFNAEVSADPLDTGAIAVVVSTFVGSHRLVMYPEAVARLITELQSAVAESERQGRLKLNAG